MRNSITGKPRLAETSSGIPTHKRSQAKPSLPLRSAARLQVQGTFGQAIPKHTYVVGGCFAEVERAIVIFKDSPQAPQFDLYIICDAVRWHTLALKNGFRESAASFTVLNRGMIWLGPKAISDSFEMRQTIHHELAHLRCNCRTEG